jgi:acyltransferase family domain protein
VVIIATIAEARSNEERIDPALEETVKKFTDAGIQVVGVRDNPRYDYNVYECAQKAGDDLESCARPVSEKLAEKNPAQEVFDKYKDKGAVLVDMTDLYCPEGMCQPVVGNVYVYIDENHVSKAYGRTMAKTMLERAAKGGWIPTGMLSL